MPFSMAPKNAEAAPRVARANEVATILRNVSGMPMGRSGGNPAASGVPGFPNSSRLAPASARVSTAGTQSTAAGDASSRTTATKGPWPRGHRARRCSMRSPEGPCSVPGGAARMAATTCER